MKKYIDRKDITEDYAREVLDIETHHDHRIIQERDGTLRWEPGAAAGYIGSGAISLNDLCPLLAAMGYDKNSEVYRKLYRDMGYSLFGYWEIFYWEANNEAAEDYVPNASGLPVS